MKQLKKIICIVLLLVTTDGVYSQITTVTTGGDAFGIGGTVSYSVGQVLCITTSGINGSVAQGVQQAYEIYTSGGIENTNININLSIYPNPTKDFLNLKIENYNNQNLSYQLYNLQGQLIQGDHIINASTSIQMSDLAKSTYSIIITKDQKIIKTFNIIKN